MSYCPECEAVIEEQFEDVGEVVACPECGVELEVVSVDPVEFDLAVVDEEDDDGEEELDYDETEDDEEWDEDETLDEDEEKEEDY